VTNGWNRVIRYWGYTYMYHRHSSNGVITDMMSEIHYTIIAFIGGEHRKLSSRHCFPWSLMFTSYEGNTWFIISKLLWYSNYNYGTGLGKKRMFNTFPDLLVSGAVHRATTYCFPLHYICLGCPPGCLPRQQIFCTTSKLSYYFYIVKIM
jgi:hypothetical protein